MKEQSHKTEMRAALQGDFERLRARREDGPPVAIAPPVEEPMTEPEPAPALPVTPVVADPVAAAPPPARSWLDRLRDRR